MGWRSRSSASGAPGDRGIGPARTSPATWDRFAESLRFAGVGDGFGALRDAIAEAREELGEEAAVLYYLSLPPAAAAGTVEALGGPASARARG